MSGVSSYQLAHGGLLLHRHRHGQQHHQHPQVPHPGVPPLLQHLSSEATTAAVAGTEATGSNNWWALLALALVMATAAGNILVCLAIAWERRLQNVTNYFLMSLAITDLMVAILVMPLGIVTLVRGHFPLPPAYCLAWICLDVLFCTASIMHLCTISVDRYLSLRYPMRFGRNKTRRRVTLKIAFVWLLSVAMSLPLSLKYSAGDANTVSAASAVLVDGTCHIPDPLYKLVGSIVCFYIPLAVMLGTYALTVRLLARQGRGLEPRIWAAPVRQTSERRRLRLGRPPAPPAPTPPPRRDSAWRRLLTVPNNNHHQHSSGTSTDTELTELWLQETEPEVQAPSALHQFGAEMLKLSRGLEAMAPMPPPPPPPAEETPIRRRRASTFHAAEASPLRRHRRGASFHGRPTEVRLQTTSASAPRITVMASRRTTTPPSSGTLRTESVGSRGSSSRHGRIIRLEQKATKVLGVVFFTFVLLWAPFFVLNLVPSVCESCERRIDAWVFDLVTWLGYASSMVNPVFYTIFNKVFRQAFRKVLLCRYGSRRPWRCRAP